MADLETEVQLIKRDIEDIKSIHGRLDVAIDKSESEISHDGDNKIKYLHYDEYKPLLEKYKINFISPISIIENASYEQLVNQLIKNVFLIKSISSHFLP